MNIDQKFIEDSIAHIDMATQKAEEAVRRAFEAKDWTKVVRYGSELERLRVSREAYVAINTYFFWE